MTPILSEDDIRLLFWALPNEIVNGVGYEHFEVAFGLTQDEYVAMTSRFRSEANALNLSRQESVLMKTSLSEVLDNLGSEFQTRTGYRESEAKGLLKRLDAFTNQQELVAE